MLEARLFWITVLVVLVAAAFALRRGTDEAVVRITGMVLELLGIGTVVWGIRETRAFFGRPSLLTLAQQWFTRVPPFRRQIVTSSSDTAVGTARGSSNTYALSTIGPDATADERLLALETNLDRAIKWLDQIHIATDEGLRLLGETLKREERSRTAEDQQIRQKLEATETGGLHISAMGTLWLIVGVIFSSVPAELAKWFG